MVRATLACVVMVGWSLAAEAAPPVKYRNQLPPRPPVAPPVYPIRALPVVATPVVPAPYYSNYNNAYSQYGPVNPYANPYTNPYANPYATPYANPYGSPYANPYASPYANPYPTFYPAGPYASQVTIQQTQYFYPQVLP